MIAHAPPLTADEELTLWRAAVAGDVVAQNRLVSCHQGYVFKLALNRQRRCKYIELGDLVQIGTLKMIQMLPHFDPSYGTRLMTYCGRGIENAMNIALNTSRVVRPSVNPMGFRESSRLASFAASMQVASMSRFDDFATTEAASRVLYGRIIDGPVSDGIENEERELFALAVATLPERMQRIIEMRLDGQTLIEIGAAMGVCKERIRQLQVKAIERIRYTLNIPPLPARAKGEVARAGCGGA